MSKALGMLAVAASLGTAWLHLAPATGDPAAIERLASVARFSVDGGFPSPSRPSDSSRPQAERAGGDPGPRTAEAPPARMRLAQAPVQRDVALKPSDDEGRRALARSIQSELRRVGCYDGVVDGLWGPATRRALAVFIERINASLPTQEPDYILLTLLQGQPSAVCGNGCPAGQAMAAGGRCLPRAVLAQSDRRPGEAALLAGNEQPAGTIDSAARLPASPHPRPATADAARQGAAVSGSEAQASRQSKVAELARLAAEKAEQQAKERRRRQEAQADERRIRLEAERQRREAQRAAQLAAGEEARRTIEKAREEAAAARRRRLIAAEERRERLAAEARERTGPRPASPTTQPALPAPMSLGAAVLPQGPQMPAPAARQPGAPGAAAAAADAPPSGPAAAPVAAIAPDPAQGPTATTTPAPAASRGALGPRGRLASGRVLVTPRVARRSPPGQASAGIARAWTGRSFGQTVFLSLTRNAP